MIRGSAAVAIVLGPELITNGTLDTNISGWSSNATTSSWSNGAMRVSGGGLYQDIPVTVGRTYTISGNFTVISGAGGTGVFAYHGAGFTTPAGNSQISGVPFNVTATTSIIRVYAYTDGTTTTDFDNISVKHDGNLVTNGDFPTDTSGWTPTAGTFTVTGGRLRLTTTGVPGTAGYAEQFVPTVVGKNYMVSVDLFAGTTSCYFNVGQSAPYLVEGTISGSGAPYYFTATSSSTRLLLRNNSSTDGEYAEFDNVSIKPVGLPKRRRGART